MFGLMMFVKLEVHFYRAILSENIAGFFQVMVKPQNR